MDSVGLCAYEIHWESAWDYYSVDQQQLGYVRQLHDASSP